MSEAEEYLKQKSIFYDLISKESLSEKIVDKRLKAGLSETIGYYGRYSDALEAVSLARKEEIKRTRSLINAYIKTFTLGLDNSFTDPDKMIGLRKKLKVLLEFQKEYEKEVNGK